MIARPFTLAVGLTLGSLVSGQAQDRPRLGPKDGPTDPPTDLERVKEGSPAPDFTLEALDGRRVTLSDVRGQKNVVLVFYRGHW
jgi:cytochrome oxidase Cu insertion factor (SCO1/SenC/PrrC family)